MVVEADLHVHSHHSDGLHAPARLVAIAVHVGLRAIALTDHDTVNGIQEAKKAAPGELEVVAGVELSSAYRGREIHLLAYDIDPIDAALRGFLEPFRRERLGRARRIVARLNAIGVPVTMQEVERLASAGVTPPSIGRPHIARAIVDHGMATDVDEAFARFLDKDRPAFVPRSCIPVHDAIRLVRSRGGSLVVAHPALDLSMEQTEALASEGLDGLEVWHPAQNLEVRESLLGIAKRYGLVATGGSDYHGAGRRRDALAAAGVSLDVVRTLREGGRRKRH